MESKKLAWYVNILINSSWQAYESLFAYIVTIYDALVPLRGHSRHFQVLTTPAQYGIVAEYVRLAGLYLALQKYLTKTSWLET